MTHNLRAESITIEGHEGFSIEAYIASPTDVSAVGSVVVIHHLPGYDEATKEITRKFAANGYIALMPNLYYRIAPGAASDDAAAAARNAGGVPDGQMVGDANGARDYLRRMANSNGKVAVIGYCSGGRQALLAGCRVPFDAVIDCYGGSVASEPPSEHPLQVTPVVGELGGLSGPFLGLFGADDTHPSPQENEVLAGALSRAGKVFTLKSFPGAGHAFFGVDRPGYRFDAATEGWIDVLTFLNETIA
jgi:carboxymethylenebutenolidase